MYTHGKSKLKDDEKVRKEHRTDYQIEVLNECTGEWYIRRYGLKTIEEAHRYLKEHNSYMPEPMRILKCEWGSTTTIVEDSEKALYENVKIQIQDALMNLPGRKNRSKVLQHFLEAMNRCDN